jgi:hypothetical protein
MSAQDRNFLGAYEHMKRTINYSLYSLPLAGAVVAAAALTLGAIAPPAYAAGCEAGDCTYYFGEVAYTGTCTADDSGKCGCLYGGVIELQEVCNS